MMKTGTATDILWTETNKAIIAGEWYVARAGLERLLDEHHPGHDEFVRPVGAPKWVADRIDAWNLRARRVSLTDDRKEALIDALVEARQNLDSARAELALAALRGEPEALAALTA